ncbi:MAG: bifunctional UDP-N-acetylmuramoyl-tripeptide:D-alanyl-D-alanine ligase/alanine racemase [Leadbetterella sp.]|nr:bifunctional UDP-N-acetylmuramoyl-tripeptide:D-alanyl-D-alanine ligase/alanine racemase [Leadbetterella sp.]
MFADIDKLDVQGKVLLTDSRFLSDPEKSIFFAIRGIRHDGHRFIQDLFQAGLREFVVEEEALTAELKTFLENPGIRAYTVSSSIGALQQLAARKRARYRYPVVGITGSNGKTIVKEWLSSLLEKDFDIVKSPRSYNSQIGVALSVWEMSSKNDLGIFEAGISQPGEMEALEKMIRPTLGIFTNIGSSHSEGFRDSRQKIREKLLLFREAEALVYCRDHREIEEEVEGFLRPLNAAIRLISWSASDIRPVDGKLSLAVSWGAFSGVLPLPFSDSASVENAVHCAYAGLYLLDGADPGRFFERFRFLNPVEMRLELKEGREGNYVIDDTYNNDLGGLKMALNFMSQTHTKRDKVLILSDVFQSGLSGQELMTEMLDLIRPQKIRTFIGIGENLSAFPVELPGTEVKLFKTTAEFLKSGILDRFQKSLILVKGARYFSFEQIVERLVKRIHGTVLEINLDAVTHNLNFYRSRIGPDTRLMVMVKAFAYGSGNEVAAWLQYHRVDYLTVAYPDEGVALRQNGITLPIMVMNADPDSYSTVFEHRLEPEIYSFRVLEAYLKAKMLWKPAEVTRIHLKIDTGMHRLGFVESEAGMLIETLKKHKTVEVASIFSHLVGADAAEHNAFSRGQIACFERVSSRIISETGYTPFRHICNTAGIIRFPEAKYDMVRLGIGLYGVESSGMETGVLEPVATLKTTISQIKELPAGETVGYSRSGVLERNSRIATIAIGYADGYDRRFSRGRAVVNVNGTLCPTVGNVCMDMTMIDVTDADCREGDEVIVFGENPGISELAERIGTIPYELLTGVSERVKRVFYHA